MINYRLLPVKFVQLGAGAPPALRPGQNPDTVRLDPAGELYFNEEHVTLPQLDARLKTMAADPTRTMVFLALQEGGRIDRAPLYGLVMDTIRAHGLEMVKVGQPGAESGEAPQAK